MAREYGAIRELPGQHTDGAIHSLVGLGSDAIFRVVNRLGAVLPDTAHYSTESSLDISEIPPNEPKVDKGRIHFPLLRLFHRLQSSPQT